MNQAAGTPDLAPAAPDLSPAAPGIAPAAPGLTAATSGLTPAASGIAPATPGLTAAASGIAPDRPGLISDSRRGVVDRSGLLRYVSPVLYRWPEFATTPEHFVVALFIDVAGFTRLSEALAMLGPEGAELLDRSITRYFDGLNKVLEPAGGILLKVSGDALTAIFRCEPASPRAAMHRAVACAAALNSATQGIGRVETPTGVHCLEHKVGIGAGRLLSGFVGDGRIRSELVFAGQALDSAAAAEHHAKAGQVWASPEALQLLESSSCLFTANAEGFGLLTDEAAALALADGDLTAAGPVPTEPPDVDAVLERYASSVPAAVREAAARGTLNYLTRHQEISALFIGCPGMRFDSPAALQQLDAHYRWMQQLINEYGGFLSEFEAGDKGAKLIVLFGAPAFLEAPAIQALRCATAMQQGAREMGLIDDQRIGLSVGRLYVGSIGCGTMAKYSALGDRMNLAARLMSAAGRWEVLGSPEAIRRSQSVIRWGKARTLKVKGKEEVLEIRPLSIRATGRRIDRRGRGLIGRKPERRHLEMLIRALEGGQGAVLELQSAAGLGKTRMLGALERLARDQGSIRVLRGREGPTPVSPVPFQAWRPLLLDFIGAPDGLSSEALTAAFVRWLETLPADLRRSAALLGSLLDIDLSVLSVDARLAALPPERLLTLRRRALIEAILVSGAATPRLLILDNFDGCDGPSLELLLELAPNLVTMPLLVALARRPDMPGRRDPLSAVRELVCFHAMALTPLSSRDAASLACRHLQVKALEPELEALLASQAGGNPLLIQGWIDVLRENGHLRVLDRIAYLARHIDLHTLPHQMEGLILAQLQLLPPDAQLSIGVASVLGDAFTAADIQALHPEPVTGSAVKLHFRLANRAGLLMHDRDRPEQLFFSSRETLEAIHDSLPFALRRLLHARRAADLLQKKGDARDHDQILRLAHHFQYIDDPPAQESHFHLALDVSRERYDHPAVVRWAGHLIDVSRRSGLRRHYMGAIDALQHALSQLGEQEERLRVLETWVREASGGQPTDMVRALYVSALHHQRSGEGEAAHTDLDRALEVARSAGDPLLLIDALNAANSVHAEAGRMELAVEAADEALELCPESESARLWSIYFARGSAFHALRRHEAAYRDFSSALEISQATGHLTHQALLLGNMSLQLWSMGSPEKGHRMLVRSIELKRQLGDRREIAIGLLNLGYSWLKLGNLAQARSSTDEALRFFARIGYSRGELYAAGNLGEILWLSGELEAAAAAYNRAEELITQLQYEPALIEQHVRQGELAIARGDLSGARDRFESASRLAAAAQQPGFQCAALEGLAEICLREGDLEQARASIEAAISHLSAHPQAVAFPVRVLWRASRIALARERPDEARELESRAATLLKKELEAFPLHSTRNNIIRTFIWNRDVLMRRRTKPTDARADMRFKRRQRGSRSDTPVSQAESQVASQVASQAESQAESQPE